MTKERFGELLKGKRLSAGMTQRDLALAIKVYPEAISRYEHGKCLPRVDMFRDIVVALGCQPGDLLDFTESPESSGESQGSDPS